MLDRFTRNHRIEALIRERQALNVLLCPVNARVTEMLLCHPQCRLRKISRHELRTLKLQPTCKAPSAAADLQDSPGFQVQVRVEQARRQLMPGRADAIVNGVTGVPRVVASVDIAHDLRLQRVSVSTVATCEKRPSVRT